MNDGVTSLDIPVESIEAVKFPHLPFKPLNRTPVGARPGSDRPHFEAALKQLPHHVLSDLAGCSGNQNQVPTGPASMGLHMMKRSSSDVMVTRSTGPGVPRLEYVGGSDRQGNDHLRRICVSGGWKYRAAGHKEAVHAVHLTLQVNDATTRIIGHSGRSGWVPDVLES